MVITIHQPEHLPWLGFFDKARQADVLILLDHVQFRKNYYQNRNRIRSNEGVVWVTVPVLRKGQHEQAINEVMINDEGSPRWKEKCWASIAQNYRKAPYWSTHEEFLTQLYKTAWVRLVDMNEAIIRYTLAALSVDVKIMRSSEMNVKGQRGELLLDICRKVGADVYLSGISGREYLDLKIFADAGVEVRFQEFHHPIYKQLHDPFIPCLAAVDLLLNYGPASPDIIKGVGIETLDQVFL